MARSAEFFNDWANPNDYGDGIYSVLDRDEDGTSWLCAAAKAKPDPFGTGEKLALARALVPHIQQAIKIHSRLSELDHRYRDFVAALDLLSDGIAMVGVASVMGCVCVRDYSGRRVRASTGYSVGSCTRRWQANDRRTRRAGVW